MKILFTTMSPDINNYQNIVSFLNVAIIKHKPRHKVISVFGRWDQGLWWNIRLLLVFNEVL